MRFYGRRGHLRRLYGITLERYEEMLAEQDGRCAICHETETQRVGSPFFAVDHDHTTGEVRGLLCGLCNKGLGCFRDDVGLMEAAIGYLHTIITQQKEEGAG